MRDKIQYRKLTKNDFPVIKRLITNVWQPDKDIHCQTMLEATLNIYLRSCLFSATNALVAVQSNEDDTETVIGIIAGTVYNSKSLFCQLDTLLCLARNAFTLLFASKKDRTEACSFLSEFSYDRTLLKGKKRRYGGSIDFFIVSSALRGKGIGKTLLNLLLDNFTKRNIKRIYLFTDTWCNYEFYDQQGFTKEASILLSIDPEAHTENRMFLYEKML